MVRPGPVQLAVLRLLYLRTFERWWTSSDGLQGGYQRGLATGDDGMEQVLIVCPTAYGGHGRGAVGL